MRSTQLYECKKEVSATHARLTRLPSSGAISGSRTHSTWFGLHRYSWIGHALWAYANEMLAFTFERLAGSDGQRCSSCAHQMIFHGKWCHFIASKLILDNQSTHILFLFLSLHPNSRTNRRCVDWNSGFNYYSHSKYILILVGFGQAAKTSVIFSSARRSLQPTYLIY